MGAAASGPVYAQSTISVDLRARLNTTSKAQDGLAIAAVAPIYET